MTIIHFRLYHVLNPAISDVSVIQGLIYLGVKLSAAFSSAGQLPVVYNLDLIVVLSRVFSFPTSSFTNSIAQLFLGLKSMLIYFFHLKVLSKREFSLPCIGTLDHLICLLYPHYHV